MPGDGLLVDRPADQVFHRAIEPSFRSGATRDVLKNLCQQVMPVPS
jgi:hypothetical protein